MNTTAEIDEHNDMIITEDNSSYLSYQTIGLHFYELNCMDLLQRVFIAHGLRSCTLLRKLREDGSIDHLHVRYS